MFYEKLKITQQQMSADPLNYEEELQSGHSILLEIELYQVAEYIHAKRIVKDVIPFLISNGFRFKISQNFLYGDGANRTPEQIGS